MLTYNFFVSWRSQNWDINLKFKLGGQIDTILMSLKIGDDPISSLHFSFIGFFFVWKTGVLFRFLAKFGDLVSIWPQTYFRARLIFVITYHCINNLKIKISVWIYFFLVLFRVIAIYMWAWLSSAMNSSTALF